MSTAVLRPPSLSVQREAGDPATATDLARFLERAPDVVSARLTRVEGSAPRGAGTEMFVAATGLHGTIGGGALEWRVIAEARSMLERGEREASLTLPLGPEIGQCCGGRVEVLLRRLDGEGRARALSEERERRRCLPQVLIFGAGHVGRALARALAPLPVRALLIDGRVGELELVVGEAETRLTAFPEAEIAAAPPGGAFIVLTHDHALDFMLASEALDRGDAAYVGLIGSATKRARFARWRRENAAGASLAGLTCPIGALGCNDKRPEVIAAFVVAEAMAALLGSETTQTVPKHG